MPISVFLGGEKLVQLCLNFPAFVCVLTNFGLEPHGLTAFGQLNYFGAKHRNNHLKMLALVARRV